MTVRIRYAKSADGYGEGSVFEIGQKDEPVPDCVALAKAAHPHATITHVVEYDVAGNPVLRDYDPAEWRGKKAKDGGEPTPDAPPPAEPPADGNEPTDEAPAGRGRRGGG